MAQRNRKKRRRNRAPDAEQKQPQKSPSTASAPFGGPPGVQGAITTSAGGEKPQNQDDRPSDIPPDLPLWLYDLEWRNVRIQKALVWVAAAALIIGGFQVKIMWTQNGIMEKQNKIMVAQQRPWLSVHATLPEGPIAGRPLHVKCEMKNSGQLPAKVTNDACEIVFFEPNKKLAGTGRLDASGFERELVFDKSFIDKIYANARATRQNFNIPPGGTGEFGIANQKAIDQKIVEDIENGRIIPVVYSVTLYTDAAGGQYTTTYCGTYSHGLKAFAKNTWYDRME